MINHQYPSIGKNGQNLILLLINNDIKTKTFIHIGRVSKNREVMVWEKQTKCCVSIAF